ncbi:LexA family transcriptional regulator [Pedobacter duraquae]|uniref:HTH cro/C1-type domain-containing protein n=1 Tax=Pedobacter duraquae TaxID=425511 RepID=A0A4R6IIW7_9SPHI|nr:LexA family transcriptional regulator [Pedobacter duraquae]TDO21934.1 hypothetical protein CLV32_3042 [Pedobacter duraquae]
MSDYQGKRFKDFLKANKISIVDAAKRLNVSRSAMYDFFNSKNMTRETVQKISDIFGISEMEMFFGKETFDSWVKIASNKDVGAIEGLSDSVPDTVKEAEDLIKRKVFSKSSAKNLPVNAKAIPGLTYPQEANDTPFIDLGNGDYLMLMPLVNEYAYAGYLAGFADPEYIEELPKHSIIVQKRHKGHYLGFEGVGDSMDDGTKQSIPDGSIVTGREINTNYWKSKFHTHRYKDYVIVSKDDGIIIKRIIDHDVENGIITCHSLNPDKITYPDFKVDLRDVKQIFNIVNVSSPR